MKSKLWIVSLLAIVMMSGFAQADEGDDFDLVRTVSHGFLSRLVRLDMSQDLLEGDVYRYQTLMTIELDGQTSEGEAESVYLVKHISAKEVVVKITDIELGNEDSDSPQISNSRTAFFDAETGWLQKEVIDDLVDSAPVAGDELLEWLRKSTQLSEEPRSVKFDAGQVGIVDGLRAEYTWESPILQHSLKRVVIFSDEGVGLNGILNEWTELVGPFGNVVGSQVVSLIAFMRRQQ